MNLHDLPKCQLPKELHEIRQKLHILQGELLELSVRNWDFDDNHISVIATKPVCDKPFVPMAKMYKELPFGAANTVELAGCVCLVSYYILMDYDLYHTEHTFEEWVNEVVEKGYRAWKFKNYPGTFTTPKIDVDKVKSYFADEVDLMCRDKEEDLIDKLGPVEGIGGSMYLIDNVIANIRDNYSKPVEDTRLTSVAGILNKLADDIYVPMRVNNAIYHNDMARAGGHYVILYGVEEGTALVWDSSIGDVRIPFKTLMEAAVADKGLTAVWNIF